MIWLLCGLLIVLGLSSYAFILCLQVYKKNNHAKEQSFKLENERHIANTKHQNYLQTSLHVIAQSYLKGELNISEACIRVKVLLDNLEMENLDKTPFSIFDEVYEKLQDFDTHQARNALPEKERKIQDRKRHFIEMKNKESLEAAFKKVANQFKIIKD
ncbi:DUF2489 domain-containing protein [Marinicellulosiphila megalodicopiae]|uniref:DUF2489 domain-containing protein n=1 Tax=Marinicellulosiphila megalodicopiae TaxID=2724896 RepID=UPI003BAF75D0